jgi:hypothetical protein
MLLMLLLEFLLRYDFPLAFVFTLIPISSSSSEDDGEDKTFFLSVFVDCDVISKILLTGFFFEG